MKIKETELKLKFSYKAIIELLEISGVTLDKIGEYGADIKNAATILYVGQKHSGGELSLQDCEDLLDSGDWNDVLEIINLFSQEVTKYFTPNSTSQLPSSK
jgi:hypothetical protein